MPLQKIVVDSADAEQKIESTKNPVISSTVQAPATTQINRSESSVQNTNPQPVRVNRPDASIAAKRPVSISINKSNNSQTAAVQDAQASYTPSAEKVVLNEKFSSEQLIAGWRAFAATLSDDMKRVGFDNTNLPELTSETQFEVLVNNVMQENELKRTQTDLVQFLITYLKNSSIKMKIRVKEESEVQRSTSPEEKYKLFAERNPILEKLRKNLQLEID